MTAIATGSAAEQVAPTGHTVPAADPAAGHTGPAADPAAGPAAPLRAVTTSLLEFALHVERHRAGLAHELGLGATDVAALLEIARHPGLRPGDLARALGLGVAGTSSVVDKLVKSGFARREPDPGDRRSLNLVLTPAGRHARGWLEDELDRTVADALGDDLDPSVAARVLSRLATRFAGTGS